MTILACALAALELQQPAGGARPQLATLETLQSPFDVALYETADLDGDGGSELLIVAADGRVRTFPRARTAPKGQGPLAREPIGTLTLPDPARTLLALVELLPESRGVQLAAFSPGGLVAYPGVDGAVSDQGVALAKRARFALRVDEPTLAPIARDVNGDGRLDFVLPAGEKLDLWMNQGPPATDTNGQPPWPAFTRTASVATEIVRGSARSDNEISDILESAFVIPTLSARDVNGDGRPDLCVSENAQRSFHLQREDGTFPEKPDVSVDLALFRDTTAESGIRPGQTLVLEDGATFESRDLNGDSIPDYAIAHRRKVWVFLASRAGPQFQTPVTILKTAEDTTALQVIALDDDPYPDLLLVKVQVPTIATLLRGVFGEWDVSITATGYRSLGGKGFEPTPAWKSELSVRVPAILDLFQHPEQFLKRFEDVASRFRGGTLGDFDGDGKTDVLLLTEDRKNAELWLGREPEDVASSRASLDRGLREILFEEKDHVWDLDRIATAFAGLAERRAAMLTGGRPSDIAVALRQGGEFSLEGLRAADFDGDGSDEVLAVWRPRSDPRRLSFDVIGIVR